MSIKNRIDRIERSISGEDALTGPGALTRLLDILAARHYDGREPTKDEQEFLECVSFPALQELAQRVYANKG